MALHRIIDSGLPPSEDAWADTTQWSVQSSSSRTIRLVNDDGTFTVLHGIGFILDGTGEPTGGRVLSLERIAADGTTVLERLDFVNVSLTDLRAAFDAGGFVDTLLDGNDVVIGTDNSRLVTAEISQETFYTGAGNDIVFGGGGANFYIDGAGSDLYIGGRTSENIDFIYDAIDYTDSAYAINVLLTGGIGSFGSHVTFDGSSDVDTLVNFESFVGSSQADEFTVTASFVNKEGTGRNWINGGAGNDVIHGNGQTVLYYFGAGGPNRVADSVYVNLGLGVAHSLNGAPEDDLANIGIDTFTGVNAVAGSRFDDVLIGSDSARAETFDGGRGNDYIDGGGGAHDRYQIETPPVGVTVDISSPVGFVTLADDDGVQTDTLVNIEEISATEFDDDITLSDVDNVAIGENGNDVIRGLAGNDTLIGDQGHGFRGTAPGNDVLIGGLGKDTMTGNEGADTFVLESILETGKTKSTRDVITDFTRGEDLVDLTAVDANVLVDGDQAFSWRGERGFSGAAGELRFVRENNPGTANDRTIIEGDVNGDRIADFQIELTGLHRLTEHDFLL
jgi:Ca2+-binding RTX toxin-like protein